MITQVTTLESKVQAVLTAAGIENGAAVDPSVNLDKVVDFEGSQSTIMDLLQQADQLDAWKRQLIGFREDETSATRGGPPNINVRCR